MSQAVAVRKTNRRRRPIKLEPRKLIEYTWEGERYTLDLDRERVYRNWMAVEAQKSFTILGAYRHQSAVTA